MPKELYNNAQWNQYNPIAMLGWMHKKSNELNSNTTINCQTSRTAIYGIYTRDKYTGFSNNNNNNNSSRKFNTLCQLSMY